MTTQFIYKKWLAERLSSVHLLLSITAACWLLAKIIGWKVWIAERTFPVIAPFDFLDNTPAFVHWFLLASSTLLLLLVIVMPGKKFVQVALFSSEIASCLLDVTRWQPWEYLYLFILLVFIINRGKTIVITTCLIVALSTVYVYSGLHKFNNGFIINMWQNMILREYFKIPSHVYHAGWVHQCGYILPIIESVAGIGLLVSKTKKPAAVVLIAMHFFILLMIGSMGLHYNKIILPWNVAMIVLLYLLFFKSEKSLSFQLPVSDTRNKILLSAWAILPALSFLGWWDNYLSWNIYSSTLPSMVICIKDTSATTPLRRYYNNKDPLNICDGNTLINLQTWAQKEMNVPPYPEERVYKKIAVQWNKTYPLSKAGFVIFYFPFRRDAARGR